MQQFHTHHIFLNASAGSGKTFALCVRYIALLFQGVQAHEILAITFTKKAANEMKERITHNLFILYITQPQKSSLATRFYKEDTQTFEKLLTQRDSLINALQEYHISKEMIQERATLVYRQFLQTDSKIATIDSYYAAILRKFAFFIGIRRDFQTQENELQELIFHDFLTRVYQDESLFQTLQILRHDLGLQISHAYKGRNALSLQTIIPNLYEKACILHGRERDIIDPQRILWRMQESARTMWEDAQLRYGTSSMAHNLYNGIIAHIDLALHDENKGLELPYFESCIIHYAEALSDYLERITPENKLGNGNLAKIHKALKSKERATILNHRLIQTKTHTYIKQSIQPDDLQWQEIEQFCAMIQDIGTLYFLGRECLLLQHIQTLIRAYAKSVQDVEQRENALSFTSISHKVFGITTDTLQGNESFQSDYFYFRLDSVTSHILFDEYQDTSILQYKIFTPLFQEILAGSGTKEARSLFFVGDSKQSLYAFRGANIAVFEQTRQNEQLKKQSLEHNYRSKRAIIDFVNTHFSQLYGEQYIHQLYGSLAQDQKGFVYVKLYESEESAQNTNNSKSNNQAAEQLYADALDFIDDLRQAGVRPKDIAILARERAILEECIEFAKGYDPTISINLDKQGSITTQRSVLALYYAFKTDEYREQASILEQRLESLKESMQAQAILQEEGVINQSLYGEQKDLGKQIDSQITLSCNPIQDDESTLKAKISQIRHIQKLSQKKLNKLLGQSYHDDSIIHIPKGRTLAAQIKSVIETCRLYHKDCMNVLEIASMNLNVRTIDALWSLLENIDSSIMQEESVHAMSVHGSKGLGFHYVIYLDSAIHKEKEIDKILYHYNGIDVQEVRLITTKASEAIYQDKALQELIANTQQDLIKQNLNNLYVACTRAQYGFSIFAHARSYIATTLQLQSTDNPPQIPPHQNDTKQTSTKKKPQIIAELTTTKARQQDFLSQDLGIVDSGLDESGQTDSLFYHHNMAMQHKKIMGLGLHYCLELMLGFSIKQPREMLNAAYGFYLDSAQIEQILHKAENIFYSKLQKLLFSDENVVKCEVSFLQENSIKRLDAIVQHRSGFSVIEFKSSQKVSEALLQEHTAQLQSYMGFIAAIFQETKHIQGYLVYLQEHIAVKEITLQIS